MNRREAVQHISLLLGGTIVGSTFFLDGCKSNNEKEKEAAFTQEDAAYLDEIADTILPTTKTPGAKAAKVGSFMIVMVNDCYTPEQQKIFHDGMKKINDLSNKTSDKSFIESTSEQKHNLLVQLDKEQKDYMKNKKPDDPSHYFRMMKELTLLGYFTSEIGCTQARRYVEVPGRYDGCVPYKVGDKAWA
jgi:hypothetical protein